MQAALKRRRRGAGKGTTGTDAVRRILAGCGVCAGLDATEIDRIARGATRVQAPRGTVLYRRGEPCRGVYVLVRGQVKLVLTSADGGEKVVEVLRADQTLGEMALYLGTPHILTAITMSDASLLHLPRAVLLAELARAPGIVRRTVATLSQRLRQRLDDLESSTTQSGMQRTAAYVVRLLRERRGGGRPIVTLPAAKGVIASRLNLSQEHFSRILGQLQAAEVLRVRGRAIRILDLEALYDCVREVRLPARRVPLSNADSRTLAESPETATG